MISRVAYRVLDVDLLRYRDTRLLLMPALMDEIHLCNVEVTHVALNGRIQNDVSRGVCICLGCKKGHHAASLLYCG